MNREIVSRLSGSRLVGIGFWTRASKKKKSYKTSVFSNIFLNDKVTFIIVFKEIKNIMITNLIEG